MSAARGVRNVAASIRQRLLDLTRAKNGNFQDCLDRYAVERLIYRLSLSDARERFLLKGALLFTAWFDVPHRPTRDADSIRVVEIREQSNYSGLRVTLRATLDNARCHLQLDVGFGDAVTPAPVEIEYPTLLDDLPRPRLRVYPRETVFAEKLEAMQVLGMANTRMKDYFDLLTLAREGAMDPKALSDAIRATFRRRGTALPDGLPLGLSDEFADDAAKRRQWDAFVRRNGLQAPSLSDVTGELGGFVKGLLVSTRSSGR